MPKHKINDGQKNMEYDLYFVVLQDPISRETKWVPYNEFMAVITHKIARQNRRQHFLFVPTLTPKQKIYSCQTENGKADLYFRDGKLEAEIVFKNNHQTIYSSDIEGLPKELLRKPEILPYYLEDALARLSPLSDGSYKLYLTPRLRGGLPWWKWGLIGVAATVGGIGILIYAYGAGAAVVAATTTAVEAAIAAAIAAEGTAAAATTVAAAAEATATAILVAEHVSVAKGIGFAWVGGGVVAGYKCGVEKEKARQTQLVENVRQQEQNRANADLNLLRQEFQQVNQQIISLTQQNTQLREESENRDHIIENNNAEINTLTQQVTRFEARIGAINLAAEDSLSDDEMPEQIRHRIIQGR